MLLTIEKYGEYDKQYSKERLLNTTSEENIAWVLCHAHSFSGMLSKAKFLVLSRFTNSLGGVTKGKLTTCEN